MWFTREQFEICNEIKRWGLQPRCETGDVVVRGFADLGYEEFQVLPGPKLLSLTAGTTSALPAEYALHLFWIPSVDESIALMEQLGAACITCERKDGREWLVQAQYNGEIETQRARMLHEALLKVLLSIYKRRYNEREDPS